MGSLLKKFFFSVDPNKVPELIFRLGTVISSRSDFHLVGLGTYYFHRGELSESLDAFIRAVQLNPKNNYAIANLGYLSSYLLTGGQINSLFYCLERLKKKADKSNHLLLKLYCSVFLRVDYEYGKKVVDREYIENLVAKNIKWFPKKSIYFIHIPKCSGTSVTEALINAVYIDKNVPLPDYTTYDLLKFCVQERMDRFPYLSSKHVDFWDIRPHAAASDVFSFTILRDPVKRVLSMYRQSSSGLKKGYCMKVIPRYGTHWNYWSYKDFDMWVNSIPKGLLLKQLSTFSEDLDVEEAFISLKRLDYTLIYDHNKGNMNELLSLMKTNLTSDDLPKSMNVSPKDIEIEKSAIENVKVRLKPEFDLLEKLRRM